MSESSPGASAESGSNVTAFERSIKQFELAWQQGGQPKIGEFLAGSDRNQGSLLVELVHVDLEYRLKAGRTARAEEYFARYPQLGEDPRLAVELIAAEYDFRRRDNPDLAPDELLRRFPQHSKELLERLKAPAGTRRPRSPIRLNCPHCQNPIEIVKDDSEEEAVCPSCGSSFRLHEDRTYSWTPAKLPSLGKFDLVDVLGRGAFGTVYRAVDMQLQRTVAVKVPRSGRLATQDDEERFFREARSAAQLQHPGIVPVYEVGRSGAFPYIVSEYVEGLSLGEVLTGRGFGFRESAQLVARVAEALDHAHQKGVVHRDVKPSNIMLSAAGTPRLMDFGLAKQEAGEVTVTIEGNILGTPAYMSPEQARGEAHQADGRTDVYSLGVVLFQMLTGEFPFRGSPRMLLHQILNDEPRSPRSLNDKIPRDLETICLKAMAKEPGRRYATAGELAAELQRYLAGKAILARPVGRLEKSWRWMRRNRTVAALAATVLAVLAGGTVVSSYFAIQAAAEASLARDEKARANRKAVEARASTKAALAEKQRADEHAAEARAHARAVERAQAEATAEANRARFEAEKAKRVAEFLAHMFEASTPRRIRGSGFARLLFAQSPGSTRDRELTSTELLARGVENVATRLNDQPAVQATLMETIGGVYIALGLGDQAEPLIESALANRRALRPEGDLETAGNLRTLALLRLLLGRFEEAVEAAREALGLLERILGEDHPEVVDAKLMTAALLAWDCYEREEISAEAETLAREVLSWRRAKRGDDHPETAYAMIGLGTILLNKLEIRDLRFDERVIQGSRAIGMFGDAAKILARDPQTKSLASAIVAFQKSRMMFTLSRYDAAVKYSTEGLESFRQGIGEEHPLFSMFAPIHVDFLEAADRSDEAERFCRQWVQGLEQIGGERNHLLARANCHLAKLLIKKAKRHEDPELFDEAEETYRASLASFAKLGLPPMKQQVSALRLFGDLLVADEPQRVLDLYEHTYGLAQKALAQRTAAQPPLRTNVYSLSSIGVTYGRLLTQLGKVPQAAALYSDLRSLCREHGAGFWHMCFANELGDVRKKQGDLAAAESLYHESLALVASIRAENPRRAANLESANLDSLAECFKARGKTDELEEMYQRIIALGDPYWLRSAKIDLAVYLSENESHAQAIAMLRELLVSRPADDDGYDIWTRAWERLWELQDHQGVDQQALLEMVEKAESKLDAAREDLGPLDDEVADLLVAIGTKYARMDRYQRAQRALREALSIRRDYLPAVSWRVGSAEALLGECLLSTMQYDEAEDLLVAGYAKLTAGLGRDDSRTIRAAKSLIQLYDAEGQPERADVYRAILPQPPADG